MNNRFKALSFYTIFFLLSLSSFAQKIRFTDSTNFWRIQKTSVTNSQINYSHYYDYWYGVDTVIGVTTYKKLLCSDSTRGYVREDTGSGIVYYYNLASAFEDTLYNYHFNVGQSISFDINAMHLTDSVYTKDSVLVNGLYHKRIDFNCANCNTYSMDRVYTLLEGIGSFSGPLFPSSPEVCSVWPEFFTYSLVCFWDSTTPVFSSFYNSCNGGGYIYNGGNCQTVEVQEEMLNNNKLFSCYPNPVNGELKIEFSKDVKGERRIQIYDMVGKIAYSQETNGGNANVDMNKLSSGVYFVQIVFEDGTKAVKKIIKE